MKYLLITSMIALGVGCGAAMAQTESVQPSGDNNCVAGQVDCQKGGKAGGQAQGKMKMQTEQNAQGKAGANTEEQAQGKAKVQTNEQAQGKTKMKTEEQAQGQAGTSTEEQAQGTAKCKTGMANCPKGTKEQAQGKTKMKTTEQNAQGKTGTTTEQNAQSKTKMQTQQNAQGKTGTTTQQNAQGNTKVQTDQDKTASINNVTVEQKTQITHIIHETHVQPVASVDFDISVGVQIPRHKIRLHRVPARIVKIVPAYEDFDYFVLADGRIIIVDPDTYEIVAILEA
ncbi:DUF1236 domain-containing protein [Mesorhizobium sp. VK23B]|uniref:DUF1236 domain-containing protein n=1 Tax=Mesorhizobium dulcispinae TaxID=3072316 RepID=A0ABU4XEB1_9HYPH|nr:MULTISPECIES: DUF1236 domain-containing protein [unclassified Mesorhizobium]MDX8466068.1 DUF1236 domain-containing protein [Mesorhizobium sp. VK23B]MDX8471879.1 DUF1236 domain-containing protein [Mesorhizobium sp. VK23A]